MPKKRRGGYVFQRHKTDHAPPHVHIYKDSKFVAKWDTQNWRLMDGAIKSRKILSYLSELINAGEL